MSQFSIFESGWVELVFEHKNKNYGAYQLRKETTKTTITAFFLAVLLIVSFISIFVLINKLNPTMTLPKVALETVIKPIDLDIIIPVTSSEPIPKSQIPSTKKTISDILSTPQLTNPQIVPAASATADKFPEVSSTNSSNITSDNGGVVSTVTTEGTPVSNPTVAENNTIVSSLTLDAAPEFPGGIKKFYQYVGNNFSKPEIDGEVTFKVVVAFVIEKDGSMTDIKILKDPGHGLGQEALRVLKSLKTKWTPGILNGKSMRTAYTLPIVIKSE